MKEFIFSEPEIVNTRYNAKACKTEQNLWLVKISFVGMIFAIMLLIRICICLRNYKVCELQMSLRLFSRWRYELQKLAMIWCFCTLYTYFMFCTIFGLAFGRGFVVANSKLNLFGMCSDAKDWRVPPPSLPQRSPQNNIKRKLTHRPQIIILLNVQFWIAAAHHYLSIFSFILVLNRSDCQIKIMYKMLTNRDAGHISPFD